MTAYSRIRFNRVLARAWVVIATLFTVAHGSANAADKVHVPFVSPSVALSLPWVAKELGDFGEA